MLVLQRDDRLRGRLTDPADYTQWHQFIVSCKPGLRLFTQFIPYFLVTNTIRILAFIRTWWHLFAVRNPIRWRTVSFKFDFDLCVCVHQEHSKWIHCWNNWGHVCTYAFSAVTVSATTNSSMMIRDKIMYFRFAFHSVLDRKAHNTANKITFCRLLNANSLTTIRDDAFSGLPHLEYLWVLLSPTATAFVFCFHCLTSMFFTGLLRVTELKL